MKVNECDIPEQAIKAALMFMKSHNQFTWYDIEGVLENNGVPHAAGKGRYCGYRVSMRAAAGQAGTGCSGNGE